MLVGIRQGDHYPRSLLRHPLEQRPSPSPQPPAMQMMQEIYGRVREEYRKHMTSKLLLVDALLAFAFSTGIIQVQHLGLILNPSSHHNIDELVCLHGVSRHLSIQLVPLGFPLLRSSLLFSRCVFSTLLAFHSCNGRGIVSLRFQMTSADFKGTSVERAYGEFAFCCLVLFFVVVSFMG